MNRVLVVDDDEDLAELLSSQLRREGFDVRCAFSVAQVRLLAQGERFDGLVTDWHLTDGSAEDVARSVQAGVRVLLAGSAAPRGDLFHHVLLKPASARDVAQALRSPLPLPA
jgi:DNA-binding response OmpR family regulator